MTVPRPRRLFKRGLAVFWKDAPIAIAGARVVAVGISFVTAPIIARTLGPEGRGEAAAAVAALALWPIIMSLGLPLEVRRHAAVTGSSSVVRVARRAVPLLVIPSIMVGIALAETLFRNGDSSTRIAVMGGLALTPAMTWWMIDSGALLARSRFRAVAVMNLIPPLVLLPAILLQWILGEVTVAGVLWATSAGAVLTAFVSAGLLGRLDTDDKAPGPRGLFTRSVSFAGSSIADAARARIDQLLSFPVMGAYQAGLYSVAATMGMLAGPLGHSIAASGFNVVAEAKGASARAQARMLTAKAGLIGGAASSVSLMIVIPFGVPLVFGHEFDSAVAPSMALAVAGGVGIMSYVLAMTLAAEGRGRRLSVIQVSSLAVLIAGVVIGAAVWGAMGAAIAVVISRVVAAAAIMKALSLGLAVFHISLSDVRASVLLTVGRNKAGPPTDLDPQDVAPA